MHPHRILDKLYYSLHFGMVPADGKSKGSHIGTGRGAITMVSLSLSGEWGPGTTSPTALVES